MKLKLSSLFVAGFIANAVGVTPAFALTSTVVTFETPGVATTYQGNNVSDITSITNGINGQGINQLVTNAPSVYVSAGTAQTISANEATFNGGVLLGLATFFPAQTFASGLNVYGTADFGINLQNALSFTTNQPTTEVSFALFNGETFAESYNISTVTTDGATHIQTVSNIGANWASGFAIVDLLFPDISTSTNLGISSVSISSLKSGGTAFDFLIDSVVFNGKLPGATSPSLYKPPTPAYVPPTNPIVVQAPELQLTQTERAVVDYGTETTDANIEARILVSKQQQVKNKNTLVFDKNGNPVFETVWELEDRPAVTLNAQTLLAPPVPEPETYAMLLAGFGVMGFVARRRRVVS